MSRRIPLLRWGAVVVIVPLVAACSQLGVGNLLKNTPLASLSPLSTNDKLEAAVALLERGKVQEANESLRAILAQDPQNSTARYLLLQIETPIKTLYSRSSVTVRVGKGETLKSIAGTHLGNPLEFYGLARYNGISNPSEVKVGQLLRVPKRGKSSKGRTAVGAPVRSDTVDSRAETAPAVSGAETTPEGQSGTAVSAPASVAKATPVNTELSETYYRQGLEAFRHQDLDVAVAYWDQALAADPNNKNAQVSRAQAIEMKKNLQELR